VFDATVNVTTPLPVPLAPAVMVIQSASLVAVRVQLPLPVTETAAEPPAAPIDSAERWRENTQLGGAGVLADCVSVTVWPATRSDVLRVAPALVSTRRLTHRA
jgi:hypothetical protein